MKHKESILNNRMTVSVIITACYEKKHIRDCILSVCNQSYDTLEILVVTDDTDSLRVSIGCEPEIFDKRIRVIHTLEDRSAEAETAGISEASGEFVYFIDGNCRIAFNAVEMAVCCAEEYHANIVAATKRDENNCYKTFTGSGKEIYYELFRRGCYEAGGKLIRRDWLLSKRFPDGMREILPYIFLWAKSAVLIDEGLYYETPYTSFPEESLSKDIVENMDRLLSYVKNRDRQVYWFTREYAARDLLTRFRWIGWNYKVKENQEFILAYKKYLRKYREDFILLKSIGIKDRLEILLYSLGFSYSFARKAYSVPKSILKNIENIKEAAILKKSDKYILLIGTEYYGNLGDHHIALSELQFLHTYFPDYRVVEIPYYEAMDKIKAYKNRIKADSVIFLHGGGNIGDEYEGEKIRHAVMKAFPHQRKIILPQTVYYKDTAGKCFNRDRKYFTKNNHVTLFCRERYSKALADEYYDCDSYLVPDLVLFSQYAFDAVREDVLFCMRQDRERSIANENCERLRRTLDKQGIHSRMTDTGYIYPIPQAERFSVLEPFLKKLASARVVVTDRIHGMVFCYITGTPCLALSNYNNKVKGVYEWIKGCNYVKFMDRLDTEADLRKAEDIINDLLKLPLEERKTVSLKSEFDEMAKIISEILINVE